MDVTDDINASGNIRTGGTQRISATGVIGAGGANATWDGITISVNRGGTGAATFASNGILYGNAASAVNVTAAGTQYQALRAGVGGVPAFGSIALNQSSAVTGTLPVGNGGTGATSLTSGGLLYGGGAGAIGAIGVLTNGQLLIGDGAGAPTTATLTGTSNQVAVSNGVGSITLSLPQSIHTGASPTFAGLDIAALGTIDMNTTGKIINLVDPSANQEAATKKYVDDATGGGSGASPSSAAQNRL